MASITNRNQYGQEFYFYNVICWSLKGVVGFFLAIMTQWATAAAVYTPVKWEKFIPVAGQSEPVPEQWLQDPEARIAHSLILPEGVPKTVPYDFGNGLTDIFSSHRKRSIAYFNHLCETEAGQWIFKTVDKVEGFYMARPQSPPYDEMSDLYGPEMPWIQRIFVLMGDDLLYQGLSFIQPPLYNYRFVEQPRRNAAWQSKIKEPYIRLFGYTTQPMLDQFGQPTIYFKEKTPMQVIGIPILTARYGYTWRGIKRVQDREHGIAGGEVLIYDLSTREVLAVRRQFLITLGNPRNNDKAAWEVATRCSKLPSNGLGSEFTQFSFDVLHTSEPSSTGRK